MRNFLSVCPVSAVWLHRVGHVGLDVHWYWEPSDRFKDFSKMLTEPRAWSIFPRSSKQLAAQKKSADDLQGQPGRALPSATKQLMKRGKD
jgi:hypothetical protein